MEYYLPLVSTGAVVVPVPKPEPEPEPDPPPAPVPVPEWSWVDVLNMYRLQEGLHALLVDPVLVEAATRWSQWMAENTFKHSDLSTVPYPRRGECIAGGYHEVEGVFKAWMASPPHRYILMDASYQYVGLGKFLGGFHGIYWTCMVGGKW